MRRAASGLVILSVLAVLRPLASAQPKPDPCSGEPASKDQDESKSMSAAPGGEPAPPPPPAAPAPAEMPAPELAPARDQPAVPEVSIGSFKIVAGGFIQPQFRLRQHDPVVGNDTEGFDVRRARPTLLGTGKAGDTDVGVYVEADTTPQFVLLDAYVYAKKPLPKDGQLALFAGQMFAPFSRQTMLSDSRRSFVEKPDLTSIAPDRQVGTKLMLRVPGAPWAQVWGGVFDGEGKNQVANIDNHFMYVGRVEIRPWGWDTPMEESAFVGKYLTIAASVARNIVIATGIGVETDLSLGGDVSFAYKGLSGTAEYLEVRHDFASGAPVPSYKANGDDFQLAYLLPLQGALHDKVEVAARVEEIDRNDTVPIVQKGDPNQSLRYYTVGLSYYQWQHRLKLQATASHVEELEDRDRNGNDASYPNDLILLMATYRME